LGTILQLQNCGKLGQKGASHVTVQEVIRALEAAGWRTTKSDDELHHLRHENEARLVTIAGKLGLSVPPGVHRTLWLYAQVEETN
jgi:predicted RNA binding protein YcfA (HicA-like mRNA interferase family)